MITTSTKRLFRFEAIIPSTKAPHTKRGRSLNVQKIDITIPYGLFIQALTFYNTGTIPPPLKNKEISRPNGLAIIHSHFLDMRQASTTPNRVESLNADVLALPSQISIGWKDFTPFLSGLGKTNITQVTWTNPFNSNDIRHRFLENLYDSKLCLDGSSQKLYSLENKGIVRLKCLRLIFLTPIVHLIGIFCLLAKIFFSPPPILSWSKKSLRLYCSELLSNLLRLLLSPFFLLATGLSAIIGLVFPYTGRKLYASFERLMNQLGFSKIYMEPWLHVPFLSTERKKFWGELTYFAPCFQPTPCGHLLSSGNQLNAF